jgi:hypothetical protein
VPLLQAKPSQQSSFDVQVALVSPQKVQGTQTPAVQVPPQQAFDTVQAAPSFVQAKVGGGPPSKQTPGLHAFCCGQLSPVHASPASQSIELAHGPPAAWRGRQPLLLPLELLLELLLPLDELLLELPLELLLELELLELVVPLELLLVPEELPEPDEALAPELLLEAAVLDPPDEELEPLLEPEPGPGPPVLFFLQVSQLPPTSPPCPVSVESVEKQAVKPRTAATANPAKATLISLVWRRVEDASTRRPSIADGFSCRSSQCAWERPRR